MNTEALGGEQEAGRKDVEKCQRLDVFKADAFNVMCPNLIFDAFLIFHCVVQHKLVFLKMLVVTFEQVIKLILQITISILKRKRKIVQSRTEKYNNNIQYTIMQKYLHKSVNGEFACLTKITVINHSSQSKTAYQQISALNVPTG